MLAFRRQRHSYGRHGHGDGGPQDHHRSLKAAQTMGLAAPSWSPSFSALLPLKSSSNFLPTPSPSSSHRVSRLSLTRGELCPHWTVGPARGCFKNPLSVNSLESIRNDTDPFLRIWSLSLSGGGLIFRSREIRGGVSGWHSGGGCCKAGLQLRYLSLLFDSWLLTRRYMFSSSDDSM